MLSLRKYEVGIFAAEQDPGEARRTECGYFVTGYFKDRNLAKADPCTYCGCGRPADLLDVPLSLVEPLL